MILKSFRVMNYRSIDDSGRIDCSRITALLGRNESGKSNLLKALESLNPPEGFEALNPVKDFPRHRRLEECTDTTPVVTTTWTLTESEKSALLELLPRAKQVEQVEVSRNYQGKIRYITFLNLGPVLFDRNDIRAKAKKLSAAVRAVAEKQADGTQLSAAADEFEKHISDVADKDAWATKTAAAVKKIRTALASIDADLSEKQEAILSEIEDLSVAIPSDADNSKQARNWVLQQLPTFIYVDEYPDLDGHQDIAAYLHRKQQNQRTPADKNFEKLCKVAGLNPAKLQELLGQNDQETRNQLVNRASAVVTNEIKRLWKDRALKIRFNVDANHFDTFISDPTATYDVEVNLNDRSRGFQWFFAFYITFAADTAGGAAEKSVLLLDEPGLYLHAKSQGDLLRHFEDDFTNQILYSTHSPFMVPTHALDRIRTVNISEQNGTTVTNDPTGDSRTLFPLQAALGYDLAQSLFVGPNNLVIEGVTDFWILSAASSYLIDSKRVGLRSDVTMTPAGGAQKISYLVALLSSESLNVKVLLDAEKESKLTKDALVKSRLIRDRGVIFVSEAFASPPAEADIEDLLEPGVYESLVRESYAAELKGKKLALNLNIPRIAKRFESAFTDLGLAFHKTRPSRLFLSKMANDAAKVMPPQSADQFEKLFTLINDRFAKADGFAA